MARVDVVKRIKVIASQNMKHVSKQAKVEIYKAVLVPTLTYENESWLLRVKFQITDMEMGILRKIKRISRFCKTVNHIKRENLRVVPVEHGRKTIKFVWTSRHN